MANLKGSKTEQNLKDAFAGESQANRRYHNGKSRADHSTITMLALRKSPVSAWITDAGRGRRFAAGARGEQGISQSPLEVTPECEKPFV